MYMTKARANKYAIRLYREGKTVAMFRERSPRTNRYEYRVEIL